MSDQTPEPTDRDDQTEASKPRVEDALAVNSLPDGVRLSAGADETEDVQRADGSLVDLPAEERTDG